MRLPFRRGTSPEVRSEWSLIRLANAGRVEVVGESHYQPALQTITGRRGWTDILCECSATLVPEPTNPYDANAVRVEIQGQTVGYLSRGDAAGYSPHLRQLAARQHRVCCDAVIAGRGPGSDTKNMGVFLHIPPPEQCFS